MEDLSRAQVLREIAAAMPDQATVLTLGGTVREMIAVAGRRANHLPNLDAMGQTISIGLGVALGLTPASVEDKVVVVEGDGSFIMGLSVVSTIGHLKPQNLVVFVLDNGVYLATGGQPTAAVDMDMCALVTAAGWAGARNVRTEEELTEALAWAKATPGPLLLRVYVDTSQIPTEYFLEDPAILAEEFRRWRTDLAEATQ
jgi:thiamine pyrophosphate-dependent acetolactate synthase large subunit-like protein